MIRRVGLSGAVMLALGTVVRSAPSDHLTFHATFDQTVDAQVAQGRAEGQARGTVAYEPGAHGQALVAGEDHAAVRYAVERNLDTRQGTLSLRFSAMNWDPAERRSHVLLSMVEGALFRLYTDGSGRIVFEIGPDLIERRRVSAPLRGFERGQWIHVVATWSAKALRLYLNGRLVDATTCARRYLPFKVTSEIEVGDLARGIGREGPRITLLDDLAVYGRPFEPASMDEADGDAAEPAPPFAPPLIWAGPAPGPIEVDGIIDAAEWAGTTSFANFLNVSDFKLAPIQTTARAAYDADHLYLAVRSPVLPDTPLRCEQQVRDGPVWTDDAVQIYLTRPDDAVMVVLIVNARGVLFDRRDQKGIKNDISWDGPWRIGTRVDDGHWSVEVAIPFAALGAPPREGDRWRLNVTRDRTEPQNLSCWARVSGYVDSEHHGTMRIGSAAAAVQLADMRVGRDGDVAIAAQAAPSAGEMEVEVLASRAGRVLWRVREDWRADVEPRLRLRHQEAGPRPDHVRLTVSAGQTVLYRTTAAPGEGAGGLKLTYAPRPGEGVCVVSVGTDDPAHLRRGPGAIVHLFPEGGGDAVRTAAIESMPDGRGTGRFDIVDLEPGRYRMRARLVAGGGVLDERTVAFVKPDEPWRQLKVGVSEVPPEPWEPLALTEHADGAMGIDCWGRSHRFVDSVLPAQIANGGVDVLSAPIRLDMRVDGKPVSLAGAAPRVGAASAVQVDMAATTDVGSLRCRQRASIEYDGMMWFEIAIEPNGPTAIDQLDLVVPLDGRFITLRQVPGDKEETGSLGRDDGWTWKAPLPRTYYLWLGDDERGVTWFYERLEQYRYADAEQVVTLQRREGTVELRIAYVGKPIRLAEPLVLAFGLQATPVRSRPAGWRAWGEPRDIGLNMRIPWTDEAFDRYGAGYPEAANPGYYQRFVAHQAAGGALVAPYKVINWHAIDSPEWIYNSAEWDLGGGVNKYSDTRRFWWGGRIDTAATSFADFIAWKYRQHIEDYRLDGLYHDLQWNYRTRRGERSFRGDRAVNKRIYTMMKQLDRPQWKIDHASNLVCSVYHGFCDIFTTGEEMRILPARKPENHATDPDLKYRVWDDYFTVMRLDYFRACGATGRQWGVVPMLLLQMTSAGPYATEGIFAILLAHDAIPTWDALTRDVTFMHRLWRVLGHFGIGEADVTFLPYWQASTPARVVAFEPEGGGPVRPVRVHYDARPEYELPVQRSFGASVYRRAGRRSLVVVFNFTEDDGVARLQLDPAALGLDPTDAVVGDAFERFRWTPAAGPLDVPVRRRNFRLLWVDSAAGAPGPGAGAAEALAPEAPLVLLAGHTPDDPRATAQAWRIAGDLVDDPWSRADVIGQRTELAQVFTLTAAARVERFEVYLTDCDGPRVNRRPVRARLVHVDEAGMPSDHVIAGETGFTTTFAAPRYWRYQRFELKRSRLLPPGRYALVVSKEPEVPEEHFHLRVPVIGVAGDGQSRIAVRVLGRDGTVTAPWRREPWTTAFRVHGCAAP